MEATAVLFAFRMKNALWKTSPNASEAVDESAGKQKVSREGAKPKNKLRVKS